MSLNWITLNRFIFVCPVFQFHIVTAPTQIRILPGTRITFALCVALCCPVQVEAFRWADPPSK